MPLCRMVGRRRPVEGSPARAVGLPVTERALDVAGGGPPVGWGRGTACDGALTRRGGWRTPGRVGAVGPPVTERSLDVVGGRTPGRVSAPSQTTLSGQSWVTSAGTGSSGA